MDIFLVVLDTKKSFWVSASSLEEASAMIKDTIKVSIAQIKPNTKFKLGKTIYSTRFFREGLLYFNGANDMIGKVNLHLLPAELI